MKSYATGIKFTTILCSLKLVFCTKLNRQDKWESLPLHLSFFFLTDGADLWNFPEGCYIFSVMCGVIPRLPLGTSDLNSKLCFMGQRATGVLLLRIGRKTTE